MQIAVTMLMRGLGYRDLPYPHGFLARAIDPTVRLLGAPAQFRVDNEYRPLEILDRDGMAMLLYNYLFSAYRRINMQWTGVHGVWEAQEEFESVFNVFGIAMRDGYVTGIPDWSINLNIDLFGQAYELTRTGRADPNDRRGAHDLRIAFVTFNEQGAPITPVYNAAVNARSRSVLGWEEELADLLGVRVRVFDDLRPAAGRRIPPSTVIGSREVIDIDDVSVTLNGDAWRGDRQLRPGRDGVRGFTMGDNSYNIEYAGNVMPDEAPWNIGDVGRARSRTGQSEFREDVNLYIFNGGRDLNNAGGTLITNRTQHDSFREFAAFINAKGNYALTRVSNGDWGGFEDFFYIFEPFEVAYRNPDRDGWMLRLTRDMNGLEANNFEVSGEWLPAGNAVNATGKEMTSAEWADFWKAGEAYFFTRNGDHFFIRDRLTKSDEIVVDRVTPHGRDNGGLRFATTPVRSFTLNNASQQRALGALNGAPVNVNLYNARMVVYTKGDDPVPYLIKNVTPDPGRQYRNYGVVIEAGGTAAGVSAYVGGQTVRAIDVFDVAANEVRPILVNNGGSIPHVAQGGYVSIVPTSTSGVFTLRAADHAQFVTTDSYALGVAMHATHASAQYKGQAVGGAILANLFPIGGNNIFDLNAGHGGVVWTDSQAEAEILGSTGTAATDRANGLLRGTANNNFIARNSGSVLIDRNTRVVVVENAGNGAAVILVDPLRDLRLLLDNDGVITTATTFSNIVAVGQARTAEGRGRASHVFITIGAGHTINNPAVTPVGEFGIVRNLTHRSVGAGMFTYEAVIYDRGVTRVVPVWSMSNNLQGSFVRILNTNTAQDPIDTSVTYNNIAVIADQANYATIITELAKIGTAGSTDMTAQSAVNIDGSGVDMNVGRVAGYNFGLKTFDANDVVTAAGPAAGVAAPWWKDVPVDRVTVVTTNAAGTVIDAVRTLTPNQWNDEHWNGNVTIGTNDYVIVYFDENDATVIYAVVILRPAA
jgi:hypothetical protein